MTERSGSGAISIVDLVSRYVGPVREAQFGQPDAPRPVVATLSSAQTEALEARLNPALARHEEARRAFVAETEKRLRLGVAGAGAAGLLLGWGAMGSLPVGLALMAGGVGFALLLMFGEAQKKPRTEARALLLDAIAGELMGFRCDSDAPDATRWKLLPRIFAQRVDMRISGQRDGCKVAASRIGFTFGGRNGNTESSGKGTAFTVVELEWPASVPEVPFITAITGTDAPPALQYAPAQTHGLQPQPTGDAAFDARYSVFASPGAPLLPPAFRAAFAALEAEARCATHGMAEVAPGQGLRPSVVLMPGYCAVLTPLAKFDGAFEPPPFWKPLEGAALIPAFASDLAIVNRHVNAALSLPTGERA